MLRRWKNNNPILWLVSIHAGVIWGVPKSVWADLLILFFLPYVSIWSIRAVSGLVGQKMVVGISNSFYVVFAPLLAPIPNFIQIGQKTRKLEIFTFGRFWLVGLVGRKMVAATSNIQFPSGRLLMTSVPSLNSIGWKLAELAHFKIFGWVHSGIELEISAYSPFLRDDEAITPLIVHP